MKVVRPWDNEAVVELHLLDMFDVDLGLDRLPTSPLQTLGLDPPLLGPWRSPRLFYQGLASLAAPLVLFAHD